MTTNKTNPTCNHTVVDYNCDKCKEWFNAPHWEKTNPYLTDETAWYADFSIQNDMLVYLNGKPMRYDEYKAIRNEIVKDLKYKQFAKLKKELRKCAI